MTLRIGSMFSGYLGLDRAVESVIDSRTAWVADIDKGACKVLAHRLPDVPNLGDVTSIDWATVPKVDIITGGSPCQDLSTAGRRAGMTDGTRSNLWVAMREAIANVKPTFVLWENVRGALSATADSDLEPCPGCVGDGRDQPALRALGRVLGDLADLGFDAEWRGVRASDVGACHQRFRVFVLAWRRDAADADGAGLQGQRDPQGAAPAQRHGHAEQGAGGLGLVTLPTPRSSDTNGAGGHGSGGLDLRTAMSLLPATYNSRARRITSETVSRRSAHAATAASQSSSETRTVRRVVPALGTGLDRPDGGEQVACAVVRVDDISEEVDLIGERSLFEGAVREHGEVRGVAFGGGERGPQGENFGTGINSACHDTHGTPCHDTRARGADALLPTPRSSDTNGAGAHGTGGPDLRTVAAMLPTPRATDGTKGGPNQRGSSGDLMLPSAVTAEQFGQYATAVARHELMIGRPAPSPTEPGKNGNPRLSARFAEWMMAVPPGWITNVPGVTRNEALKLAGNGVVPPQAAAALRDMLPHALAALAEGQAA